MSPRVLSDHEIGERLGEVNAQVSAMREQMERMERRNSAEHSEVIAALTEVRDRIDQKASSADLEELESRTDSLEATRDEGRGAIKLIAFVQGGLVALVAIAGLLLGKF